jgi:hypothetical protein
MVKIKLSIIILNTLILGSIYITMNLLQNINAMYSIKDTSGVEILKINTIPALLTVGTSFKINAVLINNSPNPIKFIGHLCGNSPLSATFSKNTDIHPAGILTCHALQLVTLNPGQKAVVTGPANAFYTANSVGKIKANVTFKYTDEAGKFENNVSKPFVFDIVS